MIEHDSVGIDAQKPTVSAGLRLVWQLVKSHPAPFATSIIGAAVFAGSTVISAAVLGWVIDEAVIANFSREVSKTTGVLGAVGAVLAIAVLRSVGVVMRRYFAGMTGERVERHTRSALANQYLAQPMSWLRSVPTGRLMAHVDSDAHVLIHALHPLPFSVGVVFLALFSGIRLFVIDPWVVLIALVLFPVMVLTNSVYSRVVRGPLSAVQQGVADIAGIAHESFEGALIVKTLGRREAEFSRFDAATQRLRGNRTRVSVVRAVLDAFLGSLPQLGILAVVVLGAYRVRAGTMTPGDIVEIAVLFSALAVPMMVFGFLLESLIPSVVAWNRLRPVVEADMPEVIPASGFSREGAIGVEVRDLRFAYPDAPEEEVLRGLHLTVMPGELVAIVGSTGSGKSTMCAAIAGVLDGARGHIILGGSPVSTLSHAERLDAVALVFQEPFLFAETIRANIDLNSSLLDSEVTRAAKVAAIDDWISSLPDGYETILGERGVTVSGGQRQRIALARALARDVGLVILDDATSAVDTVIEQQILSHLRSATNATMLVVANRLSTIDLADRVIYVRDGQVVASGAHVDLLERDDYKALVMAYAAGDA
jgi:ATP-binding cassette subfamily B protein